MNKEIQVIRSSMPDFEEYVNEIKDIWESRWLTNMGEKHRQFEEELMKYFNTPNITLFTNGHLALECAIAALKLTGEVITTPFTFASTTHAIVRSGLEPVFCDINPDDYTIDTKKIEALITDKTSCIIPVHVYGTVCDWKEIKRIANKHNLKVIYDAAHAFGVTVDGVSVANFGDATMFSFHATKVFHTIEGGAVTFQDAKLKNTLNGVKNFGFTGPESVEYVGGNGKMNEFQASMGICNLRHIEEQKSKRKTIVERYVERLSGNKGIKIVQPQEGVKSNYAYFPVVFDGYERNRNEVFEALKEKNIHVRKYFYPLTNSLACYKGRFRPEETPVAKNIAESVLTLPLYEELELEEVDRICDCILDCRKKTILVTGGAGFIGSNFIKQMLEQHACYNIINVDALTYAGNLENLTEISDHPNYRFIKADIRDKGKIDEIFGEYEITTVVNFAAESHVDRSIVDPECFVTTNILGTQVLLDIAKNHWKVNPEDNGCKKYLPGVKFLQISTDEVYGALGKSGMFKETMPLLPNSPYSASKASADLMVRAYHETFGLPVNITRCSNNYGTHQFPEKLIPLIITNCLQDKPIPVYGDGKQIRDWLHVLDHCSAIDTVLHKGIDGEIYNIGGNNERSNLEIVRLILKTLGKSEDLICYVTDRPGHDRRYAIDNTKITTQLGWKPQYTFDFGMKETIEWYK